MGFKENNKNTAEPWCHPRDDDDDDVVTIVKVYRTSPAQGRRKKGLTLGMYLGEESEKAYKIQEQNPCQLFKRKMYLQV